MSSQLENFQKKLKLISIFASDTKIHIEIMISMSREQIDIILNTKNGYI
jgi:hypothetical protein